MPYKRTSGQSGSLWVTYHTDHKIAGCESIMTICNQKCSFKPFCYSEHLQSFMPNSRNRAEQNRQALTQPPEQFVSPIFTTDIVRWCSFGSTNGDTNTLINIAYSVKMNPMTTHAIWLEPHYWVEAYKILSKTDIRMIYSNKELDTVVYIDGHVTFNVASTEETRQQLLTDHPNSIECCRNCNECGWKCYWMRDAQVIEVINR